MFKIDYKTWDGDEFVLCINDKPFGQSLNEKDAKTISEWLPGALPDILQHILRECL